MENEGAKDLVPKCQSCAVILGLIHVRRMVVPMHFRTNEDVIGPSQAQINVEMADDAVNGIDHEKDQTVSGEYPMGQIGRMIANA